MKTLFSQSKAIANKIGRWAVLLLALLSFASLSYAQRGVTIGPVVIDKGTVEPGTVFEEVIHINNEMEISRPAKVGFYNVEPFGEEGRFKVIENETDVDNRISMKSWVTLEAVDITLPPAKEQRWKDFKITLTIPKDAMPGVHYGMLLVTPDASTALDELKSSGMVLQQRQGTAIILNIAGDMKEEGSIVEFSVDHSFSEYPPVNFLARVQNNGTTYIKPVGTIRIKNLFGFVTDTIPFNVETEQKDSKRALPSMVRKFEETWNNAWITITDKEGLRVDWTKFPSLRIGPYTAELDTTYGANNDKPLTASVGFWVLPWKLLLILFAIIIIIISLFSLFVNLMKKRAIESYQKQQLAGDQNNKTQQQ